ncbi:MAG: hypothetical protein E6H57_05970 [Betaproteobacteria bacterium]|nr:MAG: hypothetical protein E6H57_05970 [Betaproteobacteria bacterium]
MSLEHPRRRSTDRPPIALPGDEPWRSGDEMIGAVLEAADGRIGEVADLVLEEETCAVTGLLVESEGQALLVPLAAVARVDWPSRRMYVRMTREEILRSLQAKL